MVDGNAGKGDNYRKVNQQKWDEGWESAFGKKNDSTRQSNSSSNARRVSKRKKKSTPNDK